MFISKNQQRLTSLLCLSVMLAGSTSTSIRHSHGYGLVPHVHGFGLARPVTPSPGADEAITVATDTSTPRHCHFILLGVEFYQGEESSHSSIPRSPGSHDVPQVSHGVAEDALLDDSPYPTESFPPRAILVIGAAPSIPSPTCLPSRLTAGPCLCDRARGERSGVSLV